MGTTRQPLYTTTSSAWRVHDIPERLRPREEMERVGTANVGDAVLLAIILRSGTKGLNVVDLAEGLLQHFRSLTAVAKATVDELQAVPGIGMVKAQIILAALELGKRLNKEAMPQRERVLSPADAARLLRETVRTLETEVFWVLHVDAKNRLTREPEEISRGLLDASLVHPREVFRGAIRAASAGVILAHNHPSGDPAPSAEDIKVTKQLVEAGRILDIGVLDHVIVGKPRDGTHTDFVSMREEGIVDFRS